jgi:hypothetical protein
MARVIAVAPELMLASRIETALTAAGHEVTVSGSLEAAEPAGAELLVVDLDTQDPKAAAGAGIPVLGFYSHTSPEIREAAEAAGIRVAVPRSRLVREMPELVSGLLETPR